MTKQQAGQLGGHATAAKYGTKPYYCEKYSCLCPVALGCKSEFHSKNGKKGAALGGTATVARHGHNHMVRIGAMGGRPRNN
jgi:hypothetical protein